MIKGAGREDKRTNNNNAPNPKIQSAAGYQGLVKIELLKRVQVYSFLMVVGSFLILLVAVSSETFISRIPHIMTGIPSDRANNGYLLSIDRCLQTSPYNQ